MLLPKDARDDASIRVMTFNVQSCARGLEAVAEAIRAAAPDLVALQEVDSGTDRSRGVNQAAALAELTGLTHHLHFRATELHGGAYGVALLSRLPLEWADQYPLPTWAGLERRTVARVGVTFNGQPLAIYVTHLTHLPSRGALRLSQAKRILALVEADPRPAILLGDLNESDASAPAVELLNRTLVDAFARSGLGPPGTFPLPAFLPELRLDYVFTSKTLRPLRSFVLRKSASDHFPLVADLIVAPLQLQASDGLR